MVHAGAIPSDWKSATFDDSTWEIPTVYGRNSDPDNYWQQHMGRAVDGIAPNAQWIWTSDGTGHNDIFCRTTSNHQPKDCAAAANRYRFHENNASVDCLSAHLGAKLQSDHEDDHVFPSIARYPENQWEAHKKSHPLHGRYFQDYPESRNDNQN
eukprot:SAG11_NODE_7003_length_1210_cov_1.990099_1_plen_153_part_10